MQHDVIIVGGSFAGLSAAMQLARAGRTVCVIDSGKPRNRFASASHGFFGQDGAAPYAMIENARAKLKAYPTVSFIDASAFDARRRGEIFLVQTELGEMAGQKLLLAFGLVDELPGIPGLRERWGRTVLHCPYCHGYEFKGQRLGVLHVGPSSAHQALLISDWGPTTLFLNGHEAPDAETCRQLEQRGVTLEPAEIAGLEGDDTELRALRLANGSRIPVAALYLGSRTRMASPIAEQLGCAFKDGMLGPIIATDEMKQTSVAGVYAAGDITRPMHNATFASADGVMAGAAMHRALIFEPLAAA